jgi:hypothetical protein
LTARFPNRNPVKIKGFGEISSRSETLGMPTPARKSLEDRQTDSVDARVGEISAKQKDTARTQRKEYGAHVAKGGRSDARLGNIREHREPKPRKRAKSTA